MSDTMKVRGVCLVYEGRGYDGVELDLPVGVARHFINLGKAVEVKVEVQKETSPLSAPNKTTGPAQS